MANRGTAPINESLPPAVVVFVLFLAVVWGGNSVSIKIALQEIPAMALAGMRFGIALVLIVMWSWLQGVPIGLRRAELIPLGLLSAIFVVQIAGLNVGTRLTSASHSAIFTNSHPFFTVLLAHWLITGEKLNLGKVVGTVIAFGGIILTFGTGLRFDSGGSLAGDSVVLLGGGLLGLRIVVAKRLVRSIHPYRLLTWMMAFAIPAFALLSFVSGEQVSLRIDLTTLVALFYQGAVVAGFCFVAWTVILSRYSASKLAVLFFATPIAGVLASHVLMGDRLTLALAAGVLLVATGILVVNKRVT